MAALDGVLELQTYGMMLHAFVDDPAVRRPQIEAALAAQGITCAGMREVGAAHGRGLQLDDHAQAQRGRMNGYEYTIQVDNLTKRFGGSWRSTRSAST